MDGQETIKVYGKEYPCHATLGAMLRYERATGKPVGEAMTQADVITLLHCLALSACAAEGAEPPSRDLQEFADGIATADFAAWSSRQAAAEPSAEKKS